MVIDNLYFGEGGHHGEFVNASFEFNTDVLSTFLRRIYNGFDTSKDFEPTMWREILRVINEATVEGLTHSSYDISQEEEFLKSLAHSNEVFSAFKVHAMGVDMAKKLVGENGKLKPFEQWKKDVAPIASHYCGSWLQTEYNTAVLRGQFAAEWKQYVADADIFPNLRWMPTTSATPDEEHKVYWTNRLTLPVSHPFWETHHPGDHWNCKCSLEQTDEAANPDVLGDVPEVKAQPGLKANPGITGEIFDETHPYIEDTPKDEKKSVKEIIKEFDSFIPASTREEAEEFATKFLSKRTAFTLAPEKNRVVSYKGIDLDIANDLNRALARIMENLDVEGVVGIKTLSPNTAKGKKEFSESDTIACFSPADGVIYINSSVLKSRKTFAAYQAKARESFEYLMRTDVQEKMSPTQREIVKKYEIAGRSLVGTSIEDAITHEFGHNIQAHLEWGGKDKRGIFVELTKDYESKGVRISGYATASRGEYFAETFNSWMIGEDIIDPELAKFFESLVKKK